MASIVGSILKSGPYANVEAKLRRFLVELGNADKILGIQVCAYKDGKVIIDTAAGVMGKDDPRPVQPDTLFPVFSTTKGVTAGIIHWLADKGKLKLDENVANIWPEFGTNGKDQIKVNHILNHTSGLHNALAGISENDPGLFCDWDECLKRIAMVAPETEPGCQQLYHYFSYGWLCGGIIEHVTGKKFQDVLEEAFVRPLNVEGELYIGIPHGVESRLATLTYDTTEFNTFASLAANTEFRTASATPSSLTVELLEDLIPLSNTLDVRRAILPAANGHFSARALARYYATLMDGGITPPRHSSSALPPLGSHPHHPTSPSNNQKDETKNASDEINTKIFSTPKSKLHDAFLGSGDYKDLILPNEKFGLGFGRVKTTGGLVIGFGHAGLGGSTGYCDINNGFSIAVTVNKMSFMNLPTSEIIRFVCSELDLPVPEDHAGSFEVIEKSVIN
ncbi:uncharacterized protein LOC111890465 [Lactuca sativa]|uniref:Beta-lactamase-related domain-containing protein n=1 Tax=Lactuca sativa TaxID=4236 RepID=A0A9R1VED9_LACSA|nr:uncharacterized protein LOC111890465 [Lactuca sativa]KAJ0203262.1 hypothetical protein LSAT_V11C500250070 [Lactuca sativa]